MIFIYTLLIELGVVVIICSSIWVYKEIKFNIEFKKKEKEWIENSFEYDGVRYSKKYFRIENGKIAHDL